MVCNFYLCAQQAICGYGTQDALPFRSVKEGELFFTEDRDINLVELALATNIPKGCAETMVRGMAHCISSHTATGQQFKSLTQAKPFTNDFSHFLVLPVNVSYLDGKGNLEPQGTGSILGILLETLHVFHLLHLQFVQIKHKLQQQLLVLISQREAPQCAP